MTQRKLATRAVHAGARLTGVKSRPLVAPLEVSAVSYFDSADDLDASLDGEDFVYQRIRGQNAELLELALAELECAEEAVAYPSGMAALKALVEAQPLKTGDRVVIAADGYGATRALCKQLFGPRGVTLEAVPLASADAGARIEALRPAFVLAESVTNPLLSVPDLPRIAAACRAVGAVLAVDATFSSPALQRTLEQGADYAVQSTTKWLNGHSDATGGVVSGSSARIRPLRAARILSGAVLGPFEAWLTLRGLRTLPLRMRAHSENALAVASALERDSRVQRVLYPGLGSHPHHEVARARLTGGYGGVVSFEVRGASRQDIFQLLERVRLCKPAPSLGDVCTLVMHPATASARRMTPEERAEAGIHENLVRVSVGLEDPDDIVADLLQALPGGS